MVKEQVYVEVVSSGFKELNTQLKSMSNNFKQYTKVVKSMSMSLRALKLNLLGAIFFGQRMVNVFMNLLRPALDAFGIFELFSTMLMVIFLPVIQAIFPYLLKIFEFFIGLPEPVKVAIGAIALIGLVLGALVVTMGMVIYGLSMIGGAITTVSGLFVGFFEVVPGVSALFSAFGAAIVGIFAAIVVVVMGFYIAFRDNIGRIRDWFMLIFEGLKNFFIGWIKIIVGYGMLLWYLITGQWGKLGEAWDKIWEGIKQAFLGTVQWLIGIAATLGLGIWTGIMWAIDEIIAGFEKLIEWGKKAWEWVKKVADIGEKDTSSDSKLVNPPSTMSALKTPSASSLYSSAAGTTNNNGGNVVVNQNINVTASNKEEIDRMIKANNKTLVDDVKKMVGT